MQDLWFERLGVPMKIRHDKVRSQVLYNVGRSDGPQRAAAAIKSFCAHNPDWYTRNYSVAEQGEFTYIIKKLEEDVTGEVFQDLLAQHKDAEAARNEEARQFCEKQKARRQKEIEDRNKEWTKSLEGKDIVLVRWRDDWADEMTLDGFVTMTTSEWNEYYKTVTTQIAFPCEKSVGSNQQIEYQTAEDYLNTLDVRGTTEEEFDASHRLFDGYPSALKSKRLSYGKFVWMEE
jgi:hypothetical protein